MTEIGNPIAADGHSATKYSKVAIILHWMIALMIIGLIVMGVLMTNPDMPNRFALYQWHKSSES